MLHTHCTRLFGAHSHTCTPTRREAARQQLGLTGAVLRSEQEQQVATVEMQLCDDFCFTHLSDHIDRVTGLG
jgi:hypothetical protein